MAMIGQKQSSRAARVPTKRKDPGFDERSVSEALIDIRSGVVGVGGVVPLDIALGSEPRKVVGARLVLFDL